jgi:hypothetical protein
LNAQKQSCNCKIGIDFFHSSIFAHEIFCAV